MVNKSKKNILWLKEVNSKDIPLVGGKNASLGEMFNQLSGVGVRIPDGFAFTTAAYWYFLKENNFEEKLKEIFTQFNPKSIKSLQETGKRARDLVLKGEFPTDLKKEIETAYQELEKKYGKNCELAVRSSGVAEDAPKDSFAGQFETFLNVKGKEKLLKAVRECLASSFNDRVIAYREEKKLSHLEFALSIGVQKMVRSDRASSGIIFTLDTETGFPDVILINSIWGVGEMIVQGKVTPDEFYVHKPTFKKGFKSIILKNLGRKTKKYIFNKKGGLKEMVVNPKKQVGFSLNDEEILILAKWACLIEEHYKIPQDIEWAKDGRTGQLFIVQSRPETVHSPETTHSHSYQEYETETKNKPILFGTAIGDKIGQGRVRVISDVSKIIQFKKGEVLVTKMTDPDWVPIMRLASAIVTDEGGKTCHASIIARELGIPAIVGVQKASKVLRTGETITVDCTQGLKGRIFKGKIPFKIKKYDLKKAPKLRTKIMLNVGAPEIAFKSSFLPNDGVGLAREEFIIAEKIRVHPLALYHYEKIRSPKSNHGEIQKIVKQIDEITIEHKDKKEFFIKELAEGIAQIAAAFYPKEVIVRFSDFKTNEYRNLIGGEIFEKEEANPMLGFRGASRYLDKNFQPAFQMECDAIKRARDVFGFKNISLMVPFCRTIEEGRGVKDLIKKFGLFGRFGRATSIGRRTSETSETSETASESGLKVYVMCEIPSNVILAEEFLEIFDGMSIGSNDLTQLVLGLDRDNAQIAYIGDERNKTVKQMISKVIRVCKEKKKYCGICGEAPSTYEDFARFLVKEGIESISLNPNSVIKTIINLFDV
ncbi:MAG: phosphoenolpyruvate synthase [Candidatus Nealsonbacteria bacterium]|nr:phosphoenolpyruvate synthase [Candidatus Nealsonbacteria bacterium]